MGMGRQAVHTRLREGYFDEHNIVVETDLHFSFYTEKYKLAFRECALWWNKEYLSMQLFSSETLLWAGGSRN